MELILNNDSLFCQYQDEQAFLDSLSENMIPCLKLAQRKNLSIVVLYSIYSNYVCSGKTLGKITDSHPLKDAEIQRFKRLLQQLASEKEVVISDSMMETVYKNGLTLLSFFPSGGKFESCYFELNSKNIPNVCNRWQLVKHLIDLKEIDYPKSQKFSYVINNEEDGKHRGAHFHISAGGEESTVRIKDFKSASKKSIHTSLTDGVNLAKSYQEDLIELWNFMNPKRPYKDEE